MNNRNSWVIRYTLAVASVVVAFLCRQGLVHMAGGELPTYITFYPAVMTVALLLGFGPGLASTVISLLLTDYFIIPPTGQFSAGSLADVIGLALFLGMGVFMSVVAELYRRSRQKANALEGDIAMTERTDAGPPSFTQNVFLNAGMLVSLAVPIAIGLMTFQNIGSFVKADHWTTHTYIVSRQLDLLLSAMKDADIDQRGFIISGDESYLERYKTALGDVEQYMDSLQQLTKDNIHQQQRLYALRPLIRARVDELGLSIELRRSRGLNAALERIDKGKGKVLMDKILAQMAEGQAEEQQLLQERLDAKRVQSDKVLKTVAGGGVTSFLLLTAVFLFLKQENRRRLKAQTELLHYQDHLNEMVVERTAQLESANRELEGFSYSVSHDLRAPLRAIVGFSSILGRDYADNLDAEGRRLLGIISDNTRKMGELIDDILRFSRMGRQDMQQADIDMVTLANDAAAKLKADLGGRAVQLVIGNLPPCHCDRSMMQQVFFNLMSNAIKFTKTRTVAEIEVGGNVQNGENLYYVRDNGVGFDIQYKDKLFGVFQRLHGMEEFEGTGIGLAIVKRIIERHGGRVWGESKLHEGATFYFTLPAVDNK